MLRELVAGARFGIGHRRRRGGLGDGGVDVAADHERDGGPGRNAVVVHVDAGEVLGVQAQLNAVPGEGGVDLVAVSEEIDRGRLGDPPHHRPPERFREHCRRRDRRRVVGEEAFDRSLLGLGMGAGVGDLLGPGHEHVVELLEGGDAPVFHLGDERLADVGVEPLLFSPALRLVRLGVHQVHAQHRAGPGQLMVGVVCIPANPYTQSGVFVHPGVGSEVA